MRRSTQRLRPALRPGSVSGWRGAARSHTTAAARSSAAWPPGCGLPRGSAPDRAPWPAARLDDLFEATVDATESAVWDSLLSATTTTGRRGLTVPALPRTGCADAAHVSIDRHP